MGGNLLHAAHPAERPALQRAKVVEDSAGTPLYMEYKGRKVADV